MVTQLRCGPFCQILKSREQLKGDVLRLQVRVEELTAEKERLRSEHAEELLVLSSSFSEHFAKSDEDSQDSIDARQSLKELDKEVQKLRRTIEDKNYHINKLQQKVLKAQFEMEEEQERHESQVECFRSELENAKGSGHKDFERLLEERLEGIRARYEGEIQDLRVQLEARENENLTNGVGADVSRELKLRKLQENETINLENWITSRQEDGKAASAEELANMDSTEPDGRALASRLECANAEITRLKVVLSEREMSESRKRNATDAQLLKGQQNASYGDGGPEARVSTVDSDGPMGNGDVSTESDSSSFLVHQSGVGPEVLEEMKADLHSQYQQQIEQLVKKLQEEYQIELDEKMAKMEEDWEQHLERQKSEHEQKMAARQRQLRAQYQTDISQVTSDMEDQIQSLKDGHAEEIAELMARMRECSEERRLSVMQEDKSQQEVVIIKEEYRSKVESLENELRAETEKAHAYQEQMAAVETQVQEFKAEKEQEVKMIEEELRKQCKLLVEKKSKEMKERYQSELNEKLNNVEKHLRREYEEDICKTKSELEESNRTLKEKYEREVSDIMVQMEDVQQRNKEVLLQEKKQFEEKQKEEFQKQLSEVMEELEPYKARCNALEEEKNQLTQKYNNDLTELKSKLDEVELRYKGNEGLDGKQLEMLRGELDMYKNKIRELEQGNKSLMENYEAQLANLRKNYEEENEAEFKTLQGEVKIYTARVEALEEERKVLEAEFENERISMRGLAARLENELNDQKTENEDKKKLNEELADKVEELSSSLESQEHSYAALMVSKNEMGNQHQSELKQLRIKMGELEGLLRRSREHCVELEKQRRSSEGERDGKLERLNLLLEEERSAAVLKDNELQKVLKDREETEKELSRVVGELDAANRKCAHLEDEILSKDRQHKEELEDLQEKMRSSPEQASGNSDEVAKNAEMAQRITDLERELRESQEYVTELEEIRRASENKQAEMEDSTVTLAESQTAGGAEAGGVRGELELSKKTITELERANAEYTKEIAMLLMDLEHLRSLQEKPDDNSCESREILEEEIKSLKAVVEEQNVTISELENEGGNKFGVLMSQHEKELEALKEELEEQIAKKREQLAKEAAWKRQKLKEEYENKLRVIYDELVAEKHKTRDQYRVNENLHQKLKRLEEDNKRQLNEISRVKQLEQTLKQVEEELFQRNAEAEKQNLEEEYREKVSSLEEEIKVLRELNSSRTTQDCEDEETEAVKGLRENVMSLENKLRIEKAEVESLRKRLWELAQNDENNVDALTEKYEDRLKNAEQEVGRLSSELEDKQSDYERSLQVLEETKTELSKRLEVAQRDKEKLETTVRQMDTAKQAVVQMYDEKIEQLAQDLDDAMEKASLSDEKLDMIERSFKAERAELSSGLSQLRLEKDELIEENKVACQNFEVELTAERESKVLLQQRLDALEGKFTDRNEEGESADNTSEENRRLIEGYQKRVETLEAELRDEKSGSEQLKGAMEEKEQQASQSESKLQELNQLVASKDQVIEGYGVRVKELLDQLESEKDKSSKLDTELRGFLDQQSSDYGQNLERIKLDLKEEYEEINETLKKNYESLFAKREDEHRATSKEMEAEMRTLREMVENLGELNKLKDDEHETLMKERIDNHEAELQEMQGRQTKEREQFLTRIGEAEQKLTEAVSENESLVAQHAVEIKEHRDEVDRWSRQAKEFDQEKNELKGRYDTEIELLNEQLVFETKFQGELQAEHQKELREQKETLASEHNKEVGDIKQDFQEKIELLESEKMRRESEVNKLTAKLDESTRELEALTERATSEQDIDLKVLEERLRLKNVECESLLQEASEHEKSLLEKCQECEGLKDRLRELTASVDRLTKETARDEPEGTSTEYDDKLSIVRVENEDLKSRIHRLETELADRDVTHQQEVEFIRAEVERQFSQREDQIAQRHSEELGVLMEKLEELVQQESASKTITEEHMRDLATLKGEFDERFERMMKEKEREVYQAKNIIEEQFRETLEELEEALKEKNTETLQLQEGMGSLQAQVQELEGKNQEQLEALERASDELVKLREENTELFRKRTSFTARHRASSDTKVLSENERLKREVQNLKNLLQTEAFPARPKGDAGEGARLVQLIKLMEQLMKEKNLLELKLRQEIIDLKTRFIGDASRASLGSASLSFASPVTGINKDSLVEALQELKENQQKQEEEIKAHLRDIESMIEEIEKRMDSVEFTDARIQEVLASQLKHLQEQRKLVIHRLWELKEKHKLLEEKITKQLADLSTHAASPNSSMDSARSKLYENLVEENLRREKELLSLKRQQASALQGRLEAEQRELERHTAKTRKLEKELKEKDRLESKLFTERTELEKQYRGKVKARELELTGHKEEANTRAQRCEPNRPHARVGLGRVGSEAQGGVPPDAHARYQPLQAAVERIRLRRSSGDCELASEDSFGSKISNNSSRSAGRSPHSSDTQQTKSTSIPTLDLDSDDSDSELGLVSGAKGVTDWHSEDSDLELYTPDSLAEADDLEQDWELTLEQELKQVSEGKLVPTPREKRKGARVTHAQVFNGPAKLKNGGERSKPAASHSRSGRLLEDEARDVVRRRQRHPRTSTAEDDHHLCFGQIDLSFVASPPRNATASKTQGRSQNDDKETEQNSKTVANSKQRQHRRTNAGHGKTSNGVAGHDVARKGGGSLYQEYKMRHLRTGAVYLLNVDDYVDRHLVKSSQDVARIRDLSPAEKRFMSRQDAPLD